MFATHDRGNAKRALAIVDPGMEIAKSQNKMIDFRQNPLHPLFVKIEVK